MVKIRVKRRQCRCITSRAPLDVIPPAIVLSVLSALSAWWGRGRRWQRNRGILSLLLFHLVSAVVPSSISTSVRATPCLLDVLVCKQTYLFAPLNVFIITLCPMHRGQLAGVSSLFYHVSYEDNTHFARLSGKYFSLTKVLAQIKDYLCVFLWFNKKKVIFGCYTYIQTPRQNNNLNTGITNIVDHVVMRRVYL